MRQSGLQARLRAQVQAQKTHAPAGICHRGRRLARGAGGVSEGPVLEAARAGGGLLSHDTTARPGRGDGAGRVLLGRGAKRGDRSGRGRAPEMMTMMGYVAGSASQISLNDISAAGFVAFVASVRCDA